jgi:hypothetical protein
MKSWSVFVPVVLAACAYATPIALTGTGSFNGNTVTFDLSALNATAHIAGDVPGGALCGLGVPCDISMFTFADSLSQVTSVFGQFQGQPFGMINQPRVTASVNIGQQITLPLGTQAGQTFNVPISLLGNISSPNLSLQFQANGIGPNIIVTNLQGGNTAGLLFSGSFNFTGTISEVPEPATVGISAAALAALALYRSRRRRTG